MKTTTRWETMRKEEKALFSGIKNYMDSNARIGYGHTISGHMLMAVMAKIYLGHPNLKRAYLNKKVTPNDRDFLLRGVTNMIQRGFVTVVTVHKTTTMMDGKSNRIIYGIKNNYGTTSQKYHDTIVVDKLPKFKLEEIGVLGVNEKAIAKYLAEQVPVK